jgi:DNA-binding IclR family transcriptional regulator
MPSQPSADKTAQTPDAEAGFASHSEPTDLTAAEAETDADQAPYLVPGLERGLRILAQFTTREPVLSAPELSRRIGIPRTTTFRLLQTLQSLGFLERANDDRSFKLGVGVLRLGFEYLNSLELTDLATPILEWLRDATGYSAHLLIRDGRDVVFVAKAQAVNPVFNSVRVHVGSRLPAHATLHGHVLMGDLTPSELRELYPEAQLERFTPHTPANTDELFQRIAQLAKQGYGISQESYERGISAISAPVRNAQGRIVAAITVTVLRSDLEQAERVSLTAAVCGAALDLSARLNYFPTVDDPTSAVAGRRVAIPSR